jgi:diadenosine tetraphosphatase ApaH/serine/threonine PP2A family protein phosphatase
LTAETPEQRLQELAAVAKVDIVLCGHSHRAFVRSIEGVYFINPGSVGRPDDGDPRASYGILRLARDAVAVDHYRLDYDIEAAVQAIRDQKLPELFAQMLLQGRSMEDIAETVEDQGPVDGPQLDSVLASHSTDPA